MKSRLLCPLKYLQHVQRSKNLRNSPTKSQTQTKRQATAINITKPAHLPQQSAHRQAMQA